MPVKWMVLFVLLLFLSGCDSEYVPPHLLYRADYDVAKVDETERLIKEIAREWNLQVYENDREQMKFLTKGKNAFYIFLNFEGDTVLSINNVGVGHILSLMAVDYGKMPLGDLDRLTAQVIDTLEERLDIEFKKEEPIALGND